MMYLDFSGALTHINSRKDLETYTVWVAQLNNVCLMDSLLETYSKWPCSYLSLGEKSERIVINVCVLMLKWTCAPGMLPVNNLVLCYQIAHKSLYALVLLLMKIYWCSKTKNNNTWMPSVEDSNDIRSAFAALELMFFAKSAANIWNL